MFKRDDVCRSFQPLAMSNCPVCVTALKSISDLGGGPHFDCPNCGQFAISDFLAPKEGASWLDDHKRTMIKHLLYERRLKKGAPIMLSDNTGGLARDKPMVALVDFLATYPRTPLEYFDRALENLGRIASHPARTEILRKPGQAALFSEGQDAKNLLYYLAEQGFITYKDIVMSDPLVGVTPRGWERIRALQQPGRDSKQAFIAMWFADAHKVYFDEAIKPAVEADGKFTALRIDRKDHNNRIDDEIIAEIRRSRFLVADFSDHRHGVYFEAGLGLGLGLPVIWCVHEDYKDKAHFDTRQFNHIVYKTPKELHDALLNRIRATIF